MGKSIVTFDELARTKRVQNIIVAAQGLPWLKVLYQPSDGGGHQLGVETLVFSDMPSEFVGRQGTTAVMLDADKCP